MWARDVPVAEEEEDKNSPTGQKSLAQVLYIFSSQAGSVKFIDEEPEKTQTTLGI